VKSRRKNLIVTVTPLHNDMHIGGTQMTGTAASENNLNFICDMAVGDTIIEFRIIISIADEIMSLSNKKLLKNRKNMFEPIGFPRSLCTRLQLAIQELIRSSSQMNCEANLFQFGTGRICTRN
jgi:hypothetical protein